MAWIPFSVISSILDGLPDWSPPAPWPREVEQAQADRAVVEPFPPPLRLPVVDVTGPAADERYPNGKRKRYRWRPVDLSSRRVLIGLHQTGVERGERRWSRTAHRITCHWAIGPTGVRYEVHPLDCRLVATNRLDRAPWHTIAIEVCGNFEGTDGSGRWWKPELMGAGRASEAQLEGARQTVAAICDEVEACGGQVVGIVPHRIAGRNRRGKPNRPICPGSRVWSQVGEWAGAELGVPIPPDGWTVGGLPIPPEWHGPFFKRCDRRIAT